MSRLGRLILLAQVAAAVLFVKIFLSILVEYPAYFPADFDANFLVGRESYFYGSYSLAFYTHILSSPLALMGAAFLMRTQGRGRFRKAHRWVGRIQGVLVLALVTPSGLFMAQYAVAGPIAGAGLTVLAFATAGCVAMAIQRARTRRFREHRQWASRSFILLSSPLLLRLISGFAIVTKLDSDWFYRFNAWLSWFVPLLVYEGWLSWSRRRHPAGSLGE